MELRTAGAVATIALEGGRLESLVIDGMEVMLTAEAAGTDKPSRFGSFPMIPWCGRLPGGRLEFDGVTHTLPLTSPPHANHGRSYLQTWEQVDDATIRTELGDPWPFGGFTTQRFELTDTSLTATAEVHPTSAAMPVMIGWHPWFRRRLARGGPAELDISPTAMYAVDAEQIPTGQLVEVPHGPWDACFVGLERPPVIRWPGALELTVSSDLDHWVIFTEPDHALCVEPQSGPPNQFHLDPVVVAPGSHRGGSMTWSWVLGDSLP